MAADESVNKLEQDLKELLGLAPRENTPSSDPSPCVLSQSVCDSNSYSKPSSEGDNGKKGRNLRPQSGKTKNVSNQEDTSLEKDQTPSMKKAKNRSKQAGPAPPNVNFNTANNDVVPHTKNGRKKQAARAPPSVDLDVVDTPDVTLSDKKIAPKKPDVTENSTGAAKYQVASKLPNLNKSHPNSSGETVQPKGPSSPHKKHTDGAAKPPESSGRANKGPKRQKQKRQNLASNTESIEPLNQDAIDNVSKVLNAVAEPSGIIVSSTSLDKNDLQSSQRQDPPVSSEVVKALNSDVREEVTGKLSDESKVGIVELAEPEKATSNQSPTEEEEELVEVVVLLPKVLEKKKKLREQKKAKKEAAKAEKAVEEDAQDDERISESSESEASSSSSSSSSSAEEETKEVIANLTPPAPFKIPKKELLMFRMRGVLPLKFMNPKFKRAIFHCRLCSFHISSMSEVYRHFREERHTRLQLQEQARQTASLMPTPTSEILDTISQMITGIYERSGLAPHHLATREAAVNLLRQMIETALPGYTIRPYGSSLTGTYALSISKS